MLNPCAVYSRFINGLLKGLIAVAFETVNKQMLKNENMFSVIIVIMVDYYLKQNKSPIYDPFIHARANSIWQFQHPNQLQL